MMGSLWVGGGGHAKDVRVVTLLRRTQPLPRHSMQMPPS